jgi:pyrimidine operon attenuation protein/uracil phosphoribosyltransferase
LAERKQFLANHAQQVQWNKGTLDINKYRDKIAQIEESAS